MLYPITVPENLGGGEKVLHYLTLGLPLARRTLTLISPMASGVTSSTLFPMWQYRARVFRTFTHPILSPIAQDLSITEKTLSNICHLDASHRLRFDSLKPHYTVSAPWTKLVIGLELLHITFHLLL